MSDELPYPARSLTTRRMRGRARRERRSATRLRRPGKTRLVSKKVSGLDMMRQNLRGPRPARLGRGPADEYPRPVASVLMEEPRKYLGYMHMALRVASVPATIAALKANEITITQGPASFGEDGQVSVFIRDPDRNVIELRGRDQGAIEGVSRYVPQACRAL